MAFNDDKSPGNKILSQDWDDFVDFTEAISGSYYGFSSNVMPSSQMLSWFNKLYQESGTSATSDVAWSGASGYVSMSGSYNTHQSDSTLHFTKTSIDDDYAGSSNYSAHKSNANAHHNQSHNNTDHTDNYYYQESDLTAVLNDNYPGSSNVNRALVNSISSNLDSRIDALEGNDTFDHTLYTTSANALSTFADSSNYSTHKGNASAHHTKYALTEDLAAGEITQIQAIDSVTINKTQWGYLGNMGGQPIESETYSSENDLTTALNDNYPASSNVNRNLINNISSNLDSRIGALETSDSPSK